MGIEITGIDDLLVKLDQTGDRTQKGVAAQMKKEAEAVRDLARKFAPVDEGYLEDAIEVEQVGGGRDSLGRFTRNSYAVFVDLTKMADDGKLVGEYAYLMHEHLTPYGPLNLGPRSRAKQQGQSEIVGGMYLARAIDQVSQDMMRRLVDVTRSEL
jgi:hypothetical protein